MFCHNDQISEQNERRLDLAHRVECSAEETVSALVVRWHGDRCSARTSGALLHKIQLDGHPLENFPIYSHQFNGLSSNELLLESNQIKELPLVGESFVALAGKTRSVLEAALNGRPVQCPADRRIRTLAEDALQNAANVLH